MNRAELDYYGVLNVPRSATHEEITLKYRELAIRLCPFRDNKYEQDFVPLANPQEITHLAPLSLNRQWDHINMAYDVLGNAIYRMIYDRYGEAGLFQGILLPNGYFPPYQFDGDAMRVYQGVFGSYSPYANLMDAVTSPPVLFTTVNGIGVRTKDAPVEKIISLDLEEVRFGCVKLMHVWRQEFVDVKQTRTEKRKKTLTLNITPGVTAGTRYIFPEEGDRSSTKTPSDIIFITADKPHKCFERRNHHDLAYKHVINLREALVGFQLSLETLDKRKLKISITDVVYPGFVKHIPCEGLPKCKGGNAAVDKSQQMPQEFGDLLIEFDFIFPTYLSRNMKDRCRQFFAELKAMEEEEQCENSLVQKFLQQYKT